MKTTLMQQGLDLLIFGMGTVFIFLTLAVVCIYGMSKIISTFFAESEPEPVISTSAPHEREPRAAAVEPKILAAIQEAIYLHRARR